MSERDYSEPDLNYGGPSVNDRSRESDPLMHGLERQHMTEHPDYYTFAPDGTPSWRATLSVVATMAGAGILGMPYSLQQSGWIGVVILIVVWVTALYTGSILIKSMYATRTGLKLKTYQDIGEAAFGRKGYYLTLFFQNAALIAVGILFMILSGLNVQSLFDAWNFFHMAPKTALNVYICAIACVVLPFIIFLKTMTEISFIGIFGMLATTFTVIVIVIFSLVERDDFIKNNGEVEHQIINYKSIPISFSSLVFAFGGHNVFPTIQDSMRRKKNYDKMLLKAFLIILGLYLPPCIIGYYAFGTKTESVILNNLSNGVVPQIATIAITLHLIVTLPIVNNPVNLWIEDATGINNSPREFLLRAVSRTILLGAQTLIAVLLPDFFDVMAFIGATCVSATVFFFPCIMYLKLYWTKVNRLEIAWICFILMIATLGSVIGLYTAVLKLIEDVGNVTLSPPSLLFDLITLITTGCGAVVIGLTMWLISRSFRPRSERL